MTKGDMLTLALVGGVAALLGWDRFARWFKERYRPEWNSRLGKFESYRGGGGLIVFWAFVLGVFLTAFLVQQ